MTAPAFYLGTHRPWWLWDGRASFPLFVSHRTLAGVRTLRPATVPGWALDSGGFTELATFGTWRTGPAEYAAAVARYDAEVGRLEWAAPQDWMCEPWIIRGGGPGNCPGTGLDVAGHQRRTVANFLQLGQLWPGVSDAESPFMPVLQGWAPGDYLECAQLYAQAGVRLEEYPAVGLGSVCRRQHTGGIGDVIRELTPWLALHGFGFKTQGLLAYGHRLTSADSMAWSYDARRAAPLPGHSHASCANCLAYATSWRARLLDGIEAAQGRGVQDDLFTPEPDACPLCGSPVCLSVPADAPPPDLSQLAPAGIYQ